MHLPGVSFCRRHRVRAAITRDKTGMLARASGLRRLDVRRGEGLHPINGAQADICARDVD
jgi:hypothetical protein